MKIFKPFILAIFGLLMVAFAMGQHPKTETFKVNGNCGSCKKHIENAVAKAEGISKISWDKKTKLVTVIFLPEKITLDKIQQKIAAEGYDTPKYKADDKAYNALDGCCKYERKG